MATLLFKLKGRTWKEWLQTILDSGKTTAPLLLLIIAAQMFSKLLAFQGITSALETAIGNLGVSPVLTFGTMVGVWLLLGSMLDSEGDTITESGAIVEYLEELYPERPMIGSDPLSRGRVRALERVGNDLCVRCQAWLWNLTDAFPAKEPAPAREVAVRCYRYVVELLDLLEATIGKNQFLAGDTATVADFTAFAIFQTARERFEQPFAFNHPKLDAWYRRFRVRPSADY